MIPTQIALIVFACVFGGALLGMWFRAVVPAHHLSESSKDVIRLGMGLIATAKSLYNTEDAVAAKVLLLDRLMSNYGPETKETRDLLRSTVANRIDAIWPEERFQRAEWDTPEAAANQSIESRILQLSPHNDTQRWLQTQALRIGSDIMETRWLVLGGMGNAIPVPFLVVVVFWVTIIFISFGLFAPATQP